MGAFATSYIPTQASQVTRNADSASMLGDNFYTWYNPNQGTVSIDTSSASGTFRRTFTLHNGTINAQIFHEILSNGFAGYNGTFQWQLAAVADGGRVAGAYLVNDIAASRNGGAVSTDTTAVIPAGINQLRLGASWDGGGVLNGHIRRIGYYNTRLPDSTLVALTS